MHQVTFRIILGGLQVGLSERIDWKFYVESSWMQLNTEYHLTQQFHSSVYTQKSWKQGLK